MVRGAKKEREVEFFFSIFAEDVAWRTMCTCHAYLNGYANSLAFIEPQLDTKDFGKIIYQILEVEKQ